MEMKILHQSELSFSKGSNLRQDEEAERKGKREGDGDVRGRAGTAHCAQDRISIMFFYCSTQTRTD